MWQSIKDFFYRLWLSFIDFMEDLFLFLVDSVMGLLVVVLDGLGSLFSVLDVTQYISAIPPEVASLMALIGLGEALGIVITAGIIRVTLQLIPFVRLGS